MRLFRRIAAILAALLVAALCSFASGAVTASANPGTNDYPYRTSAPDQVDRWQFYTRECTSFAAWRLNHDEGIDFYNYYEGVHWGNASNWDNAAAQAHVPHDKTPTHGGIAVLDTSSGHVAFILDWNKTQLYVEDYNWISFAYDKHWVSRSLVVTIIHFREQ